MQKVIALSHGPFEYELKVTPRTKRLKIIIKAGGTCVVTAPRRIPLSFIERFIVQKSDWISKNVVLAKTLLPPQNLKGTQADYLAHKDAALKIVLSRLEHYNKIYGLTYKKVTVRNQKSRWGSCSKKGNLNFNYKIVHLSPAEQDYIIVHELCHLGEFNHSRNFWELVAKTIPDHAMLRRQIRHPVSPV